jgi:DEAD/DEAH box helicase domain-containing protein
MRKIVFDIETRNSPSDFGKWDPTLLDISILAIHDSETDSYSTYTVEELPKLWPILERSDMLIGFNSEHFDIPLLNKYYPGDLTKLKSLDILKEIRKAYGRRMKLDQLAEGTLGQKKSGHGLEAIQWWKNGEIEKIKKYCVDDVRITKEIYDFALQNDKLIFKESGKLHEIILNTSEWEKPVENKMTFTLPF